MHTVMLILWDTQVAMYLCTVTIIGSDEIKNEARPGPCPRGFDILCTSHREAQSSLSQPCTQAYWACPVLKQRLHKKAQIVHRRVLSTCYLHFREYAWYWGHTGDQCSHPHHTLRKKHTSTGPSTTHSPPPIYRQTNSHKIRSTNATSWQFLR
jgi:hypothetical protein